MNKNGNQQDRTLNTCLKNFSKINIANLIGLVLRPLISFRLIMNFFIQMIKYFLHHVFHTLIVIWKEKSFNIVIFIHKSSSKLKKAVLNQETERN
jgi:hypothetical protein